MPALKLGLSIEEFRIFEDQELYIRYLLRQTNLFRNKNGV